MDAEPPPRAEVPELDKLKRYLDLGGLVFAVNEGSGRMFAQSIEQAGSLMYPQYEWRTLPRDHWAYSVHFGIRAKRPALRGLSNGVRELIIIAPAGDLAGSFQGRDESMESHFQTAGNIYLYASELSRPRPRLAVHAAVRDDIGEEGAITVVRAMHGENFNPEPEALPSLAAHLADATDLRIRIVEWPLAAIDRLSPRPALVFVSGVEPHQFSQAEQEAIRKFVQQAAASAKRGAEEPAGQTQAKAPRGGLLLFETPGGMGGFTESAEAMAEKLFGQPIVPLLHHPILTGEGLAGGEKLTTVEYRPYSAEVFAARETMPRLRGMEVDSRIRILFSREDLSHALLDRPTWGISGYTFESAIALLGNILLAAESDAGGADPGQR